MHSELAKNEDAPRRRVLLFAAAVVLSLLQPVAIAGKLECLLDCNLGGALPSIEWKPTGCVRPPPPLLLGGSSVDEYNAAVSAYNSWLSEVETYLACVRNEAQTDMVGVPAIIAEGVKKEQGEMSNEVDQQRANIQLMRP